MSPLFRRRKPVSSGNASTDSSPPDSDALDAVLDSLASVLRSYAQGVGDSEQLSAPAARRHCEAWTRHALNGSPDPSRKAKLPDEDRRSIPIGDRNWAGLRHEFRSLRASEVEYQTNLGTALRGTVMELVEVMHRALQAGQGLDADLSARSQQLKGALDGDDIAKLREASHEVAASLEHTLEQRDAVHDGLVRVLGERLRQVRDDLREATRAAEIDDLTGLANRSALDRRLHASVTLGHFAGQTECLLLLDIDRFKIVNETHGHLAGDRVLAEFSECLARAIIRRSDFVARYGGEEFAVILSDTEIDNATVVGTRLLEQIRDLSIPLKGGTSLQITASLGVAELRREDTQESWFNAADRALSLAKKGGRDQVQTRPKESADLLPHGTDLP